MIELTIEAGTIQIEALDRALKAALDGKAYGVSTYGPSRPISVWMADDATEAEQQTARDLVAAHDPVFLTIDKTTITGDGIDQAVITVTTPKVGAAAVTLLVAGVEVAVTDGTVEVAANAPGPIDISVKNPANRTTDTVTIEAV